MNRGRLFEDQHRGLTRLTCVQKRNGCLWCVMESCGAVRRRWVWKVGEAGSGAAARGREPGLGDVSDGSAPRGPARQRRLPIIYVHGDGGGVKQKATTTAAGRGRRALAAAATRGAI